MPGNCSGAAKAFWTRPSNAGLSGPGRLHDLCVNLEGASPGEMKSGGASWTITGGFAESPFGTCLVAESPRGICHLSFVETGAARAAWASSGTTGPGHGGSGTMPPLPELSARSLRSPPARTSRPPLRAFVTGTAFQVRVWRALLRVPAGQLTTYGRLAAAVGNPAAARAVGTAVGQNPLAYLIPCHRVIRETGVLGSYRWGRIRKHAIMAWERARETIVSAA